MSLSEFALIRRFFAEPAAAMATRADVVVGIGDDAAVLQPDAGRQLVVAVDTIVAGIHFPDSLPAADIAYRSLAVNLSDLAAMGATPRWFTLALTLPAVDEDWLGDFAAGLFGLAQQHDIALVGGDTTRGPLAVSVQVIGDLRAAAALRRCGARPGDLVYVSGEPGLAAAGLSDWQHGHHDTAAARCFRHPQARVSLGQGLAGLATSAIDVSDGLLADFGHILDASGVGARLDLQALGELPGLAGLDPATRQRLSLHGGDDYELCFTVPETARDQLVCIGTKLGIRLTELGCITDAVGCELHGLLVPEEESGGGGYQHF